MVARRAEAEWQGDLRSGRGQVSLGSGAYSGPYSFRSQFESGDGTNPEELIGAAHAGCFSMALAAGLSAAGYTPERIHTVATVHIEQQDGGFAIPRILLETEARVPGIDEVRFQEQAQAAKANWCRCRSATRPRRSDQSAAAPPARQRRHHRSGRGRARAMIQLAADD